MLVLPLRSLPISRLAALAAAASACATAPAATITHKNAQSDKVWEPLSPYSLEDGYGNESNLAACTELSGSDGANGGQNPTLMAAFAGYAVELEEAKPWAQALCEKQEVTTCCAFAGPSRLGYERTELPVTGLVAKILNERPSKTTLWSHSSGTLVALEAMHILRKSVRYIHREEGDNAKNYPTKVRAVFLDGPLENDRFHLAKEPLLRPDNDAFAWLEDALSVRTLFFERNPTGNDWPKNNSNRRREVMGNNEACLFQNPSGYASRYDAQCQHLRLVNTDVAQSDDVAANNHGAFYAKVTPNNVYIPQSHR